MKAITLGGAALGLLWLGTNARADKPTAEELETAVTTFVEVAHASGTDVAHRDLVAAAAMILAPLTYAGFKYELGDGHPPPIPAKACRNRWGSAGTVKAKDLPAFLKCAQLGEWQAAGDWSVEDVGKLPDLLRPFKAKLTQLAQTQTLVYSHMQIAAPPEYWTAYAGTKDADGHVRITAIIAGYVWHDD